MGYVTKCTTHLEIDHHWTKHQTGVLDRLIPIDSPKGIECSRGFARGFRTTTHIIGLELADR